MHQPVQNGIRQCVITDAGVPFIGGQLADHHRRYVTMSIIHDLHQVIPMGRFEWLQPPVVNGDHLDPGTQTVNGLKVYVPPEWNREATVKAAKLESVFANATLETCRKNGAICFDLFGDLKDQLSERHFYDLNHNNPLGTKLIREYFAMKVLQTLDAADMRVN